MDDIQVTTVSLTQSLVAKCSQSQSEGGWEDSVSSIFLIGISARAALPLS